VGFIIMDTILSNEEKKLIDGILDIEDAIFCHADKINIHQKNQLLAKKEAKELTMSILSLDNDYTKIQMQIIEDYWHKQVRKRINILIGTKQDKKIHPEKYAGKTWLYHLVDHDDIKQVKLYLFKEKIQTLSSIKENLVQKAIDNKNPEMIELLIHYQHPIYENNIPQIKKILEETSYHFNDKIKSHINIMEEKFLLQLELALQQNIKTMEL